MVAGVFVNHQPELERPAPLHQRLPRKQTHHEILVRINELTF